MAAVLAITDNYRRNAQALRKYAVAVLLTSVFFWFWAVINTARMDSGFDLGVVSFLTAALSSALLLCQVKPERDPPGLCTVVVVLTSSLFVSVNYVLGVQYGLQTAEPPRVGFATYCGVFSVLWLITAALGMRLMVTARKSSMESNSEEQIGLG